MVTAMAVAPSGSIMVALRSGRLVEFDCTDEKRDGTKVQIQVTAVIDAPAGIDLLLSDDRGAVWASVGGQVYRKEAAEDAWQRHWKLVARMPGSNHDLSGDVMGGRFYMAGGLTAERGYPARSHVFDDLFELDLEMGRWRSVAKLGYGRCFNATSYLGDKVWVIGGDIFPKVDERYAVTTVQICDPVSGEVSVGPDVEFARPMALAININARIVVSMLEVILEVSMMNQGVARA
jgi:hypothetical protein